MGEEYQDLNLPKNADLITQKYLIGIIVRHGLVATGFCFLSQMGIKHDQQQTDYQSIMNHKEIHPQELHRTVLEKEA